MDKEHSENTFVLIIKSVVVFISLAIATALILLFVAVSKVDAEIITPSQICTNNPQDTAWECKGYNNLPWQKNDISYVVATYERTNILSPNSSYNLNIQIETGLIMPTDVYNPNIYISRTLWYWNGTTWLQATPDRNENWTQTCNSNDGLWICRGVWSFDIDSTINTNKIEVRFAIVRGKTNILYNIVTQQLDYSNDTNKITGAINNQTNSINQNIDNKFSNWENAFKEEMNDTQNKQDTTNSKLQNIADSLNSDNIATYNNNTFSNLNMSSGGSIAGVITAPLSALSYMVDHNACVPITLTLPFVNQNLTLPCMDSIYTDYFGSFYTIYQAIITGIVAYWVATNIFLLTKKMSVPDDDRIEVLDL